MSFVPRVSAALGAAVSVLLLLSVLTPWFQVSYDWRILSEYRSETRFGVQDFEILIYMNGEVLANESHPYNNSYFEPVGELMENQVLLLCLSVGFSILFVISHLSRNLALQLLMGSLALTLFLAVLVNFYVGMDDAFSESGASLAGSSELFTIEGFSGSKDVSIFGISWGPTLGWWLGLVSILLESLSLLLVFFSRTRVSGH
jgi:hypothetical protein